MRIPNGHAIALEMVRACLKHIDSQRRTNHALQNISVTGPKQGPGDIKIRAYVSGRERIDAICSLNRELCGECYITTEHAQKKLGFWCEVITDAVEVTSLQGPGSEYEHSLQPPDIDVVQHLLRGAAAEWNIWQSEEGFAAIRRSWLVGEPLVRQSVGSLAEAITEQEIELGQRGKSSLIFPLLVAQVSAKS